MKACTDRGCHHTRVPSVLPPSPPPSSHKNTQQLPLQTPNHAIIGKSHTAISKKPLELISHKRLKKEKKRHFSPSQHTALHSQAITGTLERGGLPGGRADTLCPRDSTVGILRSSGQLAAESNHEWTNEDYDHHH